MQVESKLIPIMREGIDVVKMILFKKLKDRLFIKHSDRDSAFVSKLAGAMVNDLFGTPNPEASFALFVVENEDVIATEMKTIATDLQEMRIPLTDALRMQFLCDHQEGIDSTNVLTHAKELDILIVDREVPLPAGFLSLVRKLGSALHILNPMAPQHEPGRG
jgi:hypothetical protein